MNTLDLPTPVEARDAGPAVTPVKPNGSTAGNKTIFPTTLANFRELIMGILQNARAATIVEIGSEHGEFTEVLCAHSQKLGGRLISIDPAPSAAALDFIQTHDQKPYFQFLRNTSHDALPGLHADAYIVDGDHNYYTVLRELEFIEANFGDSPFLAIMHDVCWPCGRRDGYYNPSAIPAEHCHPYSDTGAIAPGNSGLADSGLLLTNVMPFALQEGGPANGVRTAAEDFLIDRSHIEFVIVPAMLGLGILYDRTAPWAQALSKFLAPFASNPLLKRLEANRLQLFLRVLELEQKLAATPTKPKQSASPQSQRALAEACLAEGKWSEAGALFQALVHHFPDDLKIWQRLLECARKRNHRTHAKLIFNDAIRLHPKWSTVLQTPT
jgi:tetratricopeptide (TPR) repeat protein